VKLATYLLAMVPERAGERTFEEATLPVTAKQIEDMTIVEIEVFRHCSKLLSEMAKQDIARMMN
jgi:hypothetical protein